MTNVYIVYHSGYGHIKLHVEAIHRNAACVAEAYRTGIAEITRRWVKGKSV